MRRAPGLPLLLSCLIATLPAPLVAQQDPKGAEVLRDTLDGAFDLSSFLLDMHGFFPLLMPITEPALGGIGAAGGPVFMRKKTAPHEGYVPPDITAGIGMYTANGSWAVGGGRIGTILPWGLRYRLFAGHADVNMDFYRDLPQAGETRITMNMRATPVMMQGIKRIGRSPWYAGLKYTWARMISRVKERDLEQVFDEDELDRTTSLLGAVVEFDRRDNVFTPNAGIRGHVHAEVSSEALGSDNDFTRGEVFLHGWLRLMPDWVSGLRLQANQVDGSPAYYQLPFIELRGIPFMRYQGTITTVVETEQRVRLWRRWSAVAFVGAGRAFDAWEEFDGADTPVNYGIGPRYLIARQLGLHTGIDLAWGPDSFGWYIVFGNAWFR